MKLTADYAAIRPALQIVARAATAKSTLPILASVRLTATDAGLELAATDLEQSVTYTIPANVTEPGIAVVPARLLSDWLGTTDGATVALDAAGRTLTATCDRSTARFNGHEPDDYPPLVAFGGDAALTFDPIAFKECVLSVAPSAAKDDNRPVLAGVHWTVRGGVAELAAADGFRLSVRAMFVESTAIRDLTALVPAKGLLEAARSIRPTGGPVEIRIADRQFCIRQGPLTVGLQSLSGTFPHYPALIPESPTTEYRIGAAAFAQAIDAAGVFARDSNGIVRLLPGDGCLHVTARTEEVGGQQATIPAARTGDAAPIAINVNFLREVVRLLPGDLILGVTSQSAPALFTPADAGPERHLHVLMPMFVDDLDREMGRLAEAVPA